MPLPTFTLYIYSSSGDDIFIIFAMMMHLSPFSLSVLDFSRYCRRRNNARYISCTADVVSSCRNRHYAEGRINVMDIESHIVGELSGGAGFSRL